MPEKKEEKPPNDSWSFAIGVVIATTIIMLMINLSSPDSSTLDGERVKTVADMMTVGVSNYNLLGSTYMTKPGEKYLIQTIETEGDYWVKIRNKEPIANGTITFKSGDTCVVRSAFIAELEKVTERGTEIRYESPVPVETGGWCPTGAILLMK